MSSLNKVYANEAKSKGGKGWPHLNCALPERGLSLIWAIVGLCGPKGCGFSAVLVINRVSILAI